MSEAGEQQPDIEQVLRERWDYVRGSHLDVELEQRSELSADMVAAAARLVVWSQFGSTSMVQRRLGISFSLAGQVMDELERYKVVGPSNGSRSRTVRHPQLATEEVFQAITEMWRPKPTEEGQS